MNAQDEQCVTQMLSTADRTSKKCQNSILNAGVEFKLKFHRPKCLTLRF